MSSTVLSLLRFTTFVAERSDRLPTTAARPVTVGPASAWRRALRHLLAAARTLSVRHPSPRDRAMSELSPVDRRLH
ncbi:MAG: hypothetical protein AAGF02_10855 [Actinomycetota bacterium]